MDNPQFFLYLEDFSKAGHLGVWYWRGDHARVMIGAGRRPLVLFFYALLILIVSMSKNNVKINFEFSRETIFLSFPYCPDIVSWVRGLPDSRKWNPKKETWEVDITIENIAYLRRAFPGMGELQQIERFLLQGLVSRPEEWYWKMKPFRHQETGFSLGVRNDRLLLSWEQGLGKTYCSVNILKYRIERGIARKILIGAPKSVLPTWRRELEKFAGLSGTIVSGSTPARRRRLIQQAQIVVMNYDLFHTHKADLLDCDSFIFDESHKLKNHDTLRSKAAVEIVRNARSVLLLSGTPVEKPKDIFWQYRLTEPGIFGTSRAAFMARYYRDAGGFWKKHKRGKKYIPREVVREERISELRQKIALRADRRLKKDCLDLPPKIFQERYIEMTGEQARVYRELYENLRVELGGKERKAANALSLKMKLFQVSSGWLKDGEEIIEFSSAKLDELGEVAENLPKVVVWCLFRHDIFRIAEKFRDFNPGLIYGDRTVAEREEDIRRFQEDEDCKMVICQFQAASTGITLTAANTNVYYNLTWTMIDYVQSTDRTHRPGAEQHKSVNYIHLLSGTADEQIYQLLQEKKFALHELMGDFETELEKNILKQGDSNVKNY